jgi:hypothetical protein
MQVLVGIGVIVILGLVPLMLSWVAQRARQRPDLQWKPTGYRYMHTGFDQVLGQKAATRATATAARRTLVASERSRPLAPRAANIVELQPRRIAR